MCHDRTRPGTRGSAEAGGLPYANDNFDLGSSAICRVLLPGQEADAFAMASDMDLNRVADIGRVVGVSGFIRRDRHDVSGDKVTVPGYHVELGDPASLDGPLTASAPRVTPTPTPEQSVSSGERSRHGKVIGGGDQTTAIGLVVLPGGLVVVSYRVPIPMIDGDVYHLSEKDGPVGIARPVHELRSRKTATATSARTVRNCRGSAEIAPLESTQPQDVLIGALACHRAVIIEVVVEAIQQSHGVGPAGREPTCGRGTGVNSE